MANALEIASLFGRLTLQDDLTPGLEKADKSLSGFADGMTKKLGDVGKALSVAVTAPIVGFVAASVKAAADAEGISRQLDAVIKSTKGVAGVTSASAKELASSLQSVTRFSDETILSAENLLLTFTNISKNVFPDATKITLDMAQALGEDTKSAAIQLGKALQDPITGITALKRVGVNFTEAQKDQIKVLVQSGNVMGAQKLILKELQAEFGGSAVAAGDTFAGKMDILNNKFNDFQEKIGNIVIPILEKGMTGLSGFVDRLATLPPSVIETGLALALAAAAVGPLLTLFSGLGTIIGAILSPIGLLVIAIGAIGGLAIQHFGGLDKLLIAAATSASQLGDILKFTVFDALNKASIAAGQLGAIVQFLLVNTLNNAATAADQLIKIIGFTLFDGLNRASVALGQLAMIAQFVVVNALNNAAQAASTIVNGIILTVENALRAVNDLINRILNIPKAPSIDSVQQMADDLAAANGLNFNDPTSTTADVGNYDLTNYASGGARAKGGPVDAGRAYTVGENGPETLVMGGSGGNIIPNGGGGPSVIHLILQASDFEQHLYYNVADAIAQGNAARSTR